MNPREPPRVVEVAGAKGPEARAFLQVPFDIYRTTPQWVPWFHADIRVVLDRSHPFFGHSQGAFFIARRGHEAIGRIAVFENTRYNESHKVRHAQFYFYDCRDDTEASDALFDAAAGWARARGLDALTGPIGIGATSGGGILVDGFPYRSAMTMMGYNHPYYAELVRHAGFEKFLDLYSFRIEAATFALPERIRRVAEIALKRGSFEVMRFRSKRELRRVADKVAEVYNVALGDHPEAYSLSTAEIERVTNDLMLVADPALIKILRYQGNVAGFLFGFPDVSGSLRAARGSVNALSIARLLWEFRRTRSLIINGAGILPQYQRLGGNALLYYELESTVKSGGRFLDADLTQIAETTGMMLSDVETIGARRYKTHRIFTRSIR